MDGLRLMPLQLHYLCTSPSKTVQLLSYQAGNISQTRKTFLSPCQVTLRSYHTATTFLFAPEGPDMQTMAMCSSCLVENRLILHEKAKTKADGPAQWARLIRQREHIVRWMGARRGEVTTDSQLLSFTPFLQRQAVRENNKWRWISDEEAVRMQK